MILRKKYYINYSIGGSTIGKESVKTSESLETVGLVEMPQLCLGTQGQLGGLAINEIIRKSFEIGYRHIDCADIYQDLSQHNWENESQSPDPNMIYHKNIKNAIQECIDNYDRENFWITWKSDNITLEHITDIRRNLGTYIDLFLIHHSCGNKSKMKILKKAQEIGLIRYYGVSNCYNIKLLEEYKTAGYNIYANQLQAMGPQTKIEGREIPENFYFNCNQLDIRVMLFSVSSALTNSYRISIFEEDYKILKPDIVNWYIHKYIKNSSNVIIVATITGSTLSSNFGNFNRIIRGEKLISDEKMRQIEEILNRITLFYM